jgi:hypothetical protein
MFQNLGVPRLKVDDYQHNPCKMELVTHLHESLLENVEHAKRNRGKHMLLKKGLLCFMFLEKEKCG